MDLTETAGQPAAPAVAMGFKPSKDRLADPEQLIIILRCGGPMRKASVSLP
jgi:hypothetical protein